MTIQPTDEMTQAQLLKKLKALGKMQDEQRNDVVCALIGHSRIMTVCFGYWSCARCNSQIGDSLGGVYEGRGKVIVGHDCEHCRESAKTLTWKDTIFAPDPFSKEDAA